MAESNFKQPNRGVTLTQHLTHQQKENRASGEFTTILTQIALAGKAISRALSQAGIFERSAFAGTTDIQSEQQRDLDDFANQAFIKVFSHSAYVSTLVSEEMTDPLHMHDKIQGGKYVVLFDPLDGSSNLAVNGLVGSIFSVLRRVETSSQQATAKDLLQKGTEQVAAGYLLYGPATLLVYSVGHGVNVYTLDKSMGEFLISKENLHIPERGLTYACNEAYCDDWHEPTRRFLEHLRRKDTKSDMHYSTRYNGALTANFHRTLMEGGVCVYPSLSSGGPITEGGRLCLTYECNPLAFIAEQCGGSATNGLERILKIQPSEVHQRSPLIIGSPYEVLLYEDFARGRKS